MVCGWCFRPPQVPGNATENYKVSSSHAIDNSPMRLRVKHAGKGGLLRLELEENASLSSLRSLIAACWWPDGVENLVVSLNRKVRI